MSTRRGMVLGKFMPVHAGHQYLIDFARHYVDELYVLVCSLEREPIPGALRHAWMRELYPDCRVVHIADEVPQAPEEHPDFWSIWQALIRRHVPAPIDYVFASEAYGFKLAEVLDAEYVPVDPTRELRPVSGTQVRREPMRYWGYLPPCVRPYYLKRVCVFGPESTGKSTLARDLARHFGTVYASEYARGLLDHKEGRCDYDDLVRIARGQAAAEDALARQAHRLLIADTDPLTTTVWARELFGRVPEEVAQLAATRDYDLYLLLDVDVPWVDDQQRYLPHRRREFFERCRQALEQSGRRYTVIRGRWADRWQQALAAVEPLLT